MISPKNTSAHIAQRAIEDAYLLLLGGVLYCWLEILWRGWTHWSMAICGGVCALAIYRINERYQRLGALRRALLGAAFITLTEFVTGCAVNLWLRLGVWDYSDQPLHLLGQICLPFSALWFLLCLPVGALCGMIRRRVFLYES